MTFVDTNRNIGIGLGLSVLDSIFSHYNKVLVIVAAILWLLSLLQPITTQVVSSIPGVLDTKSSKTVCRLLVVPRQFSATNKID
jgi:hypothetical protein